MKNLFCLIGLLFVVFAFSKEKALIHTFSKKNSLAATGGPPSSAAGQCATCPNSAVISNGDEYTPTSAADLANEANAGRTAIISNSFDVTGASFAANQILVPAGGTLSGSGINLNGAEIVINYERIFNDSARFTSSYNGCMTPENFGAAVSSDDSSEYLAVGENANYGFGQSGATYVINKPIVFKANTGNFDKSAWYWLGNGCTISSTFTSDHTTNASGVTNTDMGLLSVNSWIAQEDYLINFVNVEVPSWCDTTIEGNDQLHFGILANRDFYAFNSKWLNFFNDDASERILMMNHYTFSSNTDLIRFEKCEFKKAEPTDPGSQTGDAAGLTRGIIFNLQEVTTPRQYTVDDSDFFSFYGEGDGIHWFPAAVTNSQWNHEVTLLVSNSRFGDNTRRDIKAQHSGLQIDGCTFTKIDPTTVWGASRTTVNVGISLADTKNSTEWCINSYVKNSTFHASPNGFKAWFLAFTGTRDAVASGNTFNGPFIGIQAISLDTHTEGTTVFNNVFNDCGGVTGFDQTVGTFVVNQVYQNTTHANIDRTSRHFAAYGQPLVTNGSFRRTIIYNNTINLTYTTNSSKAHVIGTDPTNDAWDTFTYTDINLDGNSINYSGANASNKKVIDIGGNFDSTNSFMNHNPAKGVTAAGALKVDGTQTFTITNNVNGSGQTLTKQ